MDQIPPDLAKNAIQAFLTSLYNKKTEKEQKQLAKAIEDNDSGKITKLNEILSKFKDKYELETWMDYAANKMVNQIGFGTHISKGIHSSSKGDNINFNPVNDLPKTIVGHQSISIHKLDASGNAAALPLFSFYDYDVIDGKKIKDFIIEDNQEFKYALSKDSELSQKYFNIFRKSLVGDNSHPNTSEYNKQTLWHIGNYKYICVIPLYPSSLTNYIYEKVREIKYSDSSVLAKKNRFSQNTKTEHEAYPTISDLAIIKIGGSNPQGVSRHMSSQGGFNMLLPSLPPQITFKDDTFKPSKFANSIFSSSLANKMSFILQDVYKVVDSKPNNVNIRDARKKAMDEILNKLFEFASFMRNELPAGWTVDYQLDECEAFWLDPKRADLLEQEDWKAKREDPDNEWDKQIIHRFARWINALLQAKFDDMREEFADPEHNEWERELEAMKKAYERAGKGVFL